jgi:hypothetical protein
MMSTISAHDAMRALVIFPVSLFSIMFSGVVTAEKPFSFNDTPGKLPKEVLPTD